MNRTWTAVSITAGVMVVPLAALLSLSCGDGQRGEPEDEGSLDGESGGTGGADSIDSAGGTSSSGGASEEPNGGACDTSGVPEPETIAPSPGVGAAPKAEGGTIVSGSYLLKSIEYYGPSSDAASSAGAFVFQSDGTGASVTQLGFSLVREEISWQTDQERLWITPTCPTDGGTVAVDFTANAEELVLFPSEQVTHTYLLQ